VKLKEECPLPSTTLQWNRYCDPQARAWRVPYIKRIGEYERIRAKKQNDVKKTYIDITAP
jgi:hypothetical protein